MLCDYPTLWNRTTKLWLNNTGVMPRLSNGKTFRRISQNVRRVQVFIIVYTQSVHQLHLCRHADERATARWLRRLLTDQDDPTPAKCAAKVPQRPWLLSCKCVPAWSPRLYNLRDWGLGCWAATDLERWSQSSLDWAGPQFLVLCEPELHPAETWRTL